MQNSNDSILIVCTFHYGIPTAFQTCYLTANQNVRLVAFVSQFAHGIPMCPLQCSSRYSKPLSESIFWRGERAYLSHLSGSNYPSGLNNCSIVPLSHVIFDAVFLPWRKWCGDFVGMEISGIKPFVLGDHSLPPQTFMELEDI